MTNKLTKLAEMAQIRTLAAMLINNNVQYISKESVKACREKLIALDKKFAEEFGKIDFALDLSDVKTSAPAVLTVQSVSTKVENGMVVVSSEEPLVANGIIEHHDKDEPKKQIAKESVEQAPSAKETTPKQAGKKGAVKRVDPKV